MTHPTAYHGRELVIFSQFRSTATGFHNKSHIGLHPDQDCTQVRCSLRIGSHVTDAALIALREYQLNWSFVQ